VIRLVRRVNVRSFDAHGIVAIGRKRPEFLAIAQLAASIGRPLDGATVERELLGGVGAAVGAQSIGWRVIDRAVALGLLERAELRGPVRLSEAGKLAIADELVLVPEERTWRFYVAEDVLIENQLIHVEALQEPSARDTGTQLRDQRRTGQSTLPDTRACPAWLDPRAVQKRSWSSVATGNRFAVQAISSHGTDGRDGSLEVFLESKPNLPATVSLRGSLEKPNGTRLNVDRPLGTPPVCKDVRMTDLWRRLVSLGSGVTETALKTASANDPERRRVLPTVFDLQLKESLQTFVRTLAISTPSFNMLGSFNDVVLESVPLIPRSDGDAQKWAQHLQWEFIDDYAHPAVRASAREKALAKFSQHKPTLLTDAELLQKAKMSRSTPQSRYLLTAFDLGLWSAK
jgi:hypothetical protein